MPHTWDALLRQAPRSTPTRRCRASMPITSKWPSSRIARTCTPTAALSTSAGSIRQHAGRSARRTESARWIVGGEADGLVRSVTVGLVLRLPATTKVDRLVLEAKGRLLRVDQ